MRHIDPKDGNKVRAATLLRAKLDLNIYGRGVHLESRSFERGKH